MSGKDNKHNHVNSIYYDFQSRLINDFYITIGSRFDEHSVAGNEESHSNCSIYFDDKSLKFKDSYGTVLDFHHYMNYILFMLLMRSL